MSAESTEQFDQSQADRERFGFLVNPDLTYRRIVFDEDTVRATLGGVTDEVADVAFDQDGNRFHAIFRPDAAQLGQEPNPVASLARNTAETDNPEFLTDPTRAVCGPVIFTASDGDSVNEDTIAEVLQAIRAVENYRADNAEEFELWRNAVLNR
ncbi:hypothetical protein [Corynebacterium sp. HMSC034A01]|uniref:hypothetical protein n=1 Tax=Corynebacterium sp. HMSC034A01 TaxID=1739295 RepID=UPI0008A8912F|nr:hypothetical protein [Corynebacterium sp. HMSC034A01]OHR21183.1 hypothetical protein HMPREF2791_08215 [Corynebacterium sp. HMSC034A01]